MSDQDASWPTGPKHSRLGIASFVTSIAAGLLMIAAFTLGALGSVFFLAGIGGFVGFALGIAGVFHKGKKKLFAILGMVVSAPVFLMLVFYMAILASHPGN